MTTFFDHLFFWLQWPLSLLIILSLLAPYISPGFSTIPAFVNLLFPVLLIGMVVILVYGIVRLKMRFLPVFFIAIISWPAIQKTVAFGQNPNEKEDRKAFKVMSFNAKSFGRYAADSIKQQHIDMIRREKPDILCLQEFHMDRKGNVQPLKNIQETLNMKHRYLKPTDFNEKSRFYGIALLTRFPIIKKGYLDFEDHQANGFLYADLLHDSDTIRLMNAHLQSVNLIDQPMSDHQGELKALFPEDFFGKMDRLRTGFIKRARQARKIDEIIAESPHPVVFCGDFNDTPLSYSYRQMTQTLKDAFVEGGFGFGVTYAGPLPLLRIDYIMLDPGFAVMDFKVLGQQLSDHHPIICQVKAP